MLAPADELKELYGVETLEEAFFAATGRGFEEEMDEEDSSGRCSHESPVGTMRAELIGAAGVVERNLYLLSGSSWTSRSSSGPSRTR